MTLQLSATGIGLNKSRIAFTDSSMQLNEEKDAKRNPKRETNSPVESMLQSALSHVSNEEYQEALLLEKYRDALLAHARELQVELHSDLNARARKIAPKVYGWSEDAIPGISRKHQAKYEFNQLDYEEMWENLRGVAAHEYNLEDPRVSSEFFAELQELMLGKSIKKIKPSLLNRNYPWLETNDLIQKSDPMCAKSNINPILSKAIHELPTAPKSEKDAPKKKEKIKRIIEEMTKECTFKPKLSEKIPDFQALQDKFQNSLEEKKKDWAPTIAQPFENMVQHHIEQAKKAEETKKKILLNEKEECKPEKFSTIDKNQSSIRAKSTHSFNLLVRHRKETTEAQRLIQEILEEEESNAKKKKKEIADKIRSRINRSSQLTNKINKELKLKRHSQDQLRMEEDYKKRIEEMNERIANRLCLFEEAKLKCANNKVKSEIQTILKEAGLKAKDYE
ncbi:hypothetical protein HDV04_002482 [Boothiomyces sp. JEL0838]|nr:hypothetical protein HDV04_002482 [Boothiomyces sp. JEL0838]